VSYHAESDIVLNYGFLSPFTRLCPVSVNELDTPGGRMVCPQSSRASSAFARWCWEHFGGDFLTGVFNIMPFSVAAAAAAAGRNASVAARPVAVAWVSASCHRHGGYLAELRKHMPVDFLGRCFRTATEASHPGRGLMRNSSLWWGSAGQGRSGEVKAILGSQYAFYISLENTLMDDYLTEKFFQGFLMDAVMVYLGAPNAARYAPAPHSYVSALDFAGPRELAGFLLALRRDEARYASYLAWKRARPVALSPGFVDAIRRDGLRPGRGSAACRLCSLVVNGTADLNQV
jgi:hypothetical protein